MNAAAAIFVGGKAQSLEEAVKIAAQSLESGAALEKLQLLIEKTK
jgi:anthranilate phosphoribosyltransferase